MKKKLYINILHNISKILIFGFFVQLYLYGYLYSKNSLSCQTLPCLSKGNLPFTTDLNSFRAHPGKTKIEIYYILKLTDLQFENILDTLKASFSTQLTITDSSDQQIVTKEIINSTYARSTTEINQENKVLIDQVNFYLPPGKYQIQLQVTDLTSQKSGICNIYTEVIAYDSKLLSLSDIQLASAIRVDTSKNKFVKNNSYVLPNPERRFIFSRSNLYFYFEIYNLVPQDSGVANTFTLNYSVCEINSKSVIDYPSKDIRKPGVSCVKVQGIDIKYLKCGDYQLQVTIKDNFTNQEISGLKRFTIYQPELSTSVLSMTDEDIKNYRDQIKYFATNEELKLFDQLNPKGKESFLIEFWRSKDTTPETPANEFMQDCFSRIHYANKHFKGKENGLDSDMGRVFVIYGQPDDIENHTMEMDKKPYIIWHYFTTGSGKHSFVFVDLNNTGMYSLVHSTVEDEIKNEDWMERELR